MGCTEKSTDTMRLADERWALVGRITAGLAHDLNGPIGIVLGFNDLAREVIASNGPGSDLPQGQVAKVSEYLELVDGAARRARSLTQEIWEFARARPANPGAIVIERQLALAARLAAPALRTAGIETQAEPDAADSQGECGQNATLVQADPALCTQAFVGLMLEAVSTLPAGGRISWSVDASPGCGTVEVHFQAKTWENEAGDDWPVPAQSRAAMMEQDGDMEPSEYGGGAVATLKAADPVTEP